MTEAKESHKSVTGKDILNRASASRTVVWANTSAPVEAFIAPMMMVPFLSLRIREEKVFHGLFHHINRSEQKVYGLRE